MSTKCAQCGVSKGELSQCAGCKAVSYCTRDHQKAHWAKHKVLCKQISAIREKDLGFTKIVQTEGTAGDSPAAGAMCQMCALPSLVRPQLTCPPFAREGNTLVASRTAPCLINPRNRSSSSSPRAKSLLVRARSSSVVAKFLLDVPLKSSARSRRRTATAPELRRVVCRLGCGCEDDEQGRARDACHQPRNGLR